MKPGKLFVLLLTAVLCLGLAPGAMAEERSYGEEDAALLAQTIWGEARGSEPTHQAAVAWCVLNRVDSERFSGGSVREVVTAEGQFTGYSPWNPVEEEILALARDVLARWSIEPECLGDVGRVLPADYFYFSGDGFQNYFRRSYRGEELWDWSLPSPYDNAVPEGEVAASGGSSSGSCAGVTAALRGMSVSLPK